MNTHHHLTNGRSSGEDGTGSVAGNRRESRSNSNSSTQNREAENDGSHKKWVKKKYRAETEAVTRIIGCNRDPEAKVWALCVFETDENSDTSEEDIEPTPYDVLRKHQPLVSDSFD